MSNSGAQVPKNVPLEFALTPFGMFFYSTAFWAVINKLPTQTPGPILVPDCYISGCEALLLEETW